jgi:hypothetical protein
VKKYLTLTQKKRRIYDNKYNKHTVCYSQKTIYEKWAEDGTSASVTASNKKSKKEDVLPIKRKLKMPKKETEKKVRIRI